MTVDEALISRAKILIVDDEPANVRVLERVLLTGAYSDVVGTTDSRDAVGLYEQLKPDLVMLDLHMPHLSGLELLAALRERIGPTDYLPVLVLTADTTREARERALSAGARDFLTKPFERTEVLLRTRNLLETRFLHLALKDENRVLEAKLVHQAFHDSLTGLANRALFRDRVEHSLTRALRGERVSVVLLDLDDFKAVNDSLGHAEGDHLLMTIADRLLRATRGCDTVARIGGDEFTILLEGMRDDAEALIIVSRITEALRHPVSLRGRSIAVSASIGVAHASGAEDVSELLRNADVAMYRAKDGGKGRHVVFESGMHSELLERLELESDLRHAVERGQLRVVYQPIVELDGGAVIAVEALARWDRPGSPTPDSASFIPIAEETGLILPIGRWVLAEACRQGAEWLAGGTTGPTISVNVSARQLQDPFFTREVRDVLAETGFPPERLVLEITESVLMSDRAPVRERLRDLKELGVRLAIDDFGTGYANLSYLQHFPIDILKIDKSFIDHMAGGGENGRLASSIVALAATLELRTVAEGIERPEQRAQLVSLGCAYGQGYLFARPLGAEEIAALVARGAKAATAGSV